MLSSNDLRRGLPDANMIFRVLMSYSSLRFSELTGLCRIVFFVASPLLNAGKLSKLAVKPIALSMWI